MSFHLVRLYQKIGFPFPGALLDPVTDHRRTLIGTTGDLDQIDTFGGDLIDNVHRLLLRKPAAKEISRVELDSDGVVVSDRGPHCPVDLEKKTSAPGSIAAPVVLSAVVVWRQELIDQVTMRGVDLHPAETGFPGQGGAGGKASDNLRDLYLGQGPGRFEKMAEPWAHRRKSVTKSGRGP